MDTTTEGWTGCICLWCCSRYPEAQAERDLVIEAIHGDPDSKTNREGALV